MPGGDRTGPSGFGPMTGRGFGLCYGARAGGPFFGGYGRTGAFGFGGGRGWRHGCFAAGRPGWTGRAMGGRWASPGYPPETAPGGLDYLREYTAGLEAELNELRARIAELEGAAKPG